jgi:hypothetical protein
MRSKSSAVLFVYAIAALLLGIAALTLAFKIAVGTMRLFFPVIWIVLALVGLYSVIASRKDGAIKLLWVIIIILAPFFGSLLWFLWGRNNT